MADALSLLFVSVMGDRALHTKQKQGRRPSSFDERHLQPLSTFGIVFDRLVAIGKVPRVRLRFCVPPRTGSRLCSV